jgi:type IX secretion system PorP/SprF family membrane protein
MLNPAMAGDTRFAQIQLVERLQPTVSNVLISNTLLSLDYKLRNNRSGIGLHVNRTSSIFSETHMKINYSHSFLLSRRIWIKGGLGISFNTINTHINAYTFPDQYDQFGYTGSPTMEPSLNEKASYAGFSSGMAVYNDLGWVSVAFDNINRPNVNFAGSKNRIPLLMIVSTGYLFSFDKNKRGKRIFNRDGGLKPYSSLGPVASFYKNGDFHVFSAGIDAFTKPVFWGISLRYNSIYNRYFSEGVSSVHLLAGYRTEVLSVAYSYDLIVNRTPTNFKGAHEISLIFYFYSIREDYKKCSLFPYPNQLLY